MKTWKLVKKEVLHSDHWSTVNKNSYLLPNGNLLENYILLSGRDYVTIFAVTPDRKAVLIREFKPGSDKIVLQLPSGYLDDNEEPIHAAKRELTEETGFVAEKIIPLGKYRTSNGKTTSVAHGFLALNARKEKEQKLDENENISVELHPIDDLVPMLESWEIDTLDSAAFIALGMRKL